MSDSLSSSQKHQENITQLLALNNIDSLCEKMIKNMQKVTK